MGGYETVSESLLGLFGSHLLDQLDATAGVAPLVVVPAKDLDEVAVDHLGALGVDDRAQRAVVEVGADQFFVGVAQDALERALGGFLQGGVDLFGRGRLGQFDRQVGEEEKMFGSVTSRDLVEQLKKAGVDLDHRQIVLDQPIKALGKYEVPVKLAAGVVANLKFFVVAKGK